MGAALCTTNQVVNDTVQRNTNKLLFAYNVKGINLRLWQAVEQNNKINLEKFLDFNDVTESTLYDLDGQSVLHMAASLGHVEMLMMIIERTGAKPDLTNASLQTPLHLACQMNKLQVVKFLISCVDVNTQDEHGQTPIYVCCNLGFYEIVSYLIEANSSGQLTEALEIDLANYAGMTPLICSISRGDLQMVKLLVQKGCSDINQSNLNGETPLITACKLGHYDIIEFLIQKGCPVLKQDILGCTLMHYVVEKGQIEILELLAALGIDTTVVEVPDNAGRTPIFAAIENMDESPEQQQLLEILLGSVSTGGFKANPNVLDYNGRSPLFVAASKGQFQAVKILIEVGGAKADLNNGQIISEENNQITELFQQQQNFYTAYINCQTPLQIATVMGFDQITSYLQSKADVNFQTSEKKYTVLHLCVLANRPEMLIQLLNQTNADPMIEDSQGSTCLDLVFKCIPEYADTLQQLLEQRKSKQVQDESERVITGVRADDIKNMYQQQDEGQVDLNNVSEKDLQVEGMKLNEDIEQLFGRKVALCLVSQNWQYKESAMKFVLKHTEKLLARSEKEFKYLPFSLVQLVDSALTAVSLTCKDKVIKVFQLSLQLFNAVVQSTRVERDEIAAKKVVRNLKLNDTVTCLLQHSELSNSRVSTKIHEALIDLAYQTHLQGMDLVVNAVFQQLAIQKNQKGLLAHLAIIYKLVTTFTVQKCPSEVKDQGEYDGEYDPEYYAEEEVKSLITKESVLAAVLPTLSHPKDDVRQAAVKILIEVQKQTGELKKEDFESLNEKHKESIWKSIVSVNVIAQEQVVVSQQNEDENVLDKYLLILDEKGQSKDWTQREIAIQSIKELFTSQNEILFTQEDFLQKCSQLIQTSLDDNNIQIYLLSIDLLLVFMFKVQASTTLCDTLPQLLTSVVLRTTDTNTRVRKRSVEVIKQAWTLNLNKKSIKSVGQIVASVVCDPQLNDKAIVGRIGILIKKAQEIDSSEDLQHKSILVLIGKDYEQLMQFGCQWSSHKNTKVRQSALKLIVEVCRLNSIDPKGSPFKQRIISFILGLRTQIKDPLIQKVNEVCKDANPEISEPFINEADSQTRKQNNKTGDDKSLPVISKSSDVATVTTVLPHSEPLSEALITQYQAMIDLFGLNLVTCFYSQSWSSRLASIQKVKEQLHNLNLVTRDPMTCEINRLNLPPELTIKPMFEFITEGLKDPVVKNYISVLDLIQKVLPIYEQQLNKQVLSNLVQQVVAKLSDLKPKVRESTINFCLFLAHLTWIGPELIANVIFNEFEQLQWIKSDAQKKDMNQFGNSSMIVASLQILQHLQTQNQLVKSTESKLHSLYSLQVQRSLQHQNPQVRKEGEALFKILYTGWNEIQVIDQLKMVKSSYIKKLLGSTNERLENKLMTEYTDWNLISKVLDANQINEIRSQNGLKRLLAVREVKKVIQQLPFNKNLELVEPTTLLVLHLLRDDNQEVMLEVLQLIKFVVSNLAQHLSQLDLHIVIGQFITQLLSKPVSNLKVRVATDKVIVYFAKNTNIGSLVVAKEIIKNIERINKQSSLDILLRFYSILLILIQQYSIVLCYQPQFYSKLLETIAESISKSLEIPILNSALNQFIVCLYQIDAKILNDGVQKLEFSKRTHLRKIVIELDNQSAKGLVHNLQGNLSVQSPAESMRDTLSSFQSQRTQLLSPGLNMTRRLSRQSNAQPETPLNIQLPKTGVSWLERKNTTQVESTLPKIDSKSATVQRRQIGQGYVQSSSKPAGFSSGIDSSLSKVPFYQQNSQNGPALYVATQRMLVKPQDSYQPTIFQKQGVTTAGSFGMSSTTSTANALFPKRYLGNQTN